MLPFLKPRHVTGVITKVREPDGNTKDAYDEESDAGLLACAADLIKAVHAKDEQATAAAMRAAFELLELEPHDEVEHEKSE